jgi:hypothetical protein
LATCAVAAATGAHAGRLAAIEVTTSDGNSEVEALVGTGFVRSTIGIAVVRLTAQGSLQGKKKGEIE